MGFGGRLKEMGEWKEREFYAFFFSSPSIFWNITDRLFLFYSSSKLCSIHWGWREVLCLVSVVLYLFLCHYHLFKFIPRLLTCLEEDDGIN